MQRRPRGYLGLDHETIGSDILAVLYAMPNPAEIVGAQQAHALAGVDASAWYPIRWLLDLMAQIEAKVGDDGLRGLGRVLFSTSHEQRILQFSNSARDIVFGVDTMYHFANRGRMIGGWMVTRFDPGHAELEKTTPHHCMMEEGLLSAALLAVGCPARISQHECFRDGSDRCLFVVDSEVVDERWTGR